MADSAPIASHRATTSSKTPGRVNEGTVQVQFSGIRICEECGGVVAGFVEPGAHGPRVFADGAGNAVIANCVGRVIGDAVSERPDAGEGR